MPFNAEYRHRIAYGVVWCRGGDYSGGVYCVHNIVNATALASALDLRDNLLNYALAHSPIVLQFAINGEPHFALIHSNRARQ